ncbi:Cytochrome c oxidase subunit 7C, mitochondrial [Sparganum proliferum]
MIGDRLFGHMRIYDGGTDRSPNTPSTPTMPNSAHAPQTSAPTATSSTTLSTSCTPTMPSQTHLPSPSAPTTTAAEADTDTADLSCPHCPRTFASFIGLSNSLQSRPRDDSNKTSIGFIGALQAVSSLGLSSLGSSGGCLSHFKFRAAVKMSVLLRQGYRLVFSDVRFRPPGQLAWASLKTRPPAIQKIYDKLEHLEESIDQEAKPGANLPFSVEKPRALALKIILFIGIAFNMPFYIIYRHMRKAAAT